jgi:hypothetical protein
MSIRPRAGALWKPTSEINKMSMYVSTRIAFNSESRSKGQRRHDSREGRRPEYVSNIGAFVNSTIIKPIMESEMKSICNERRASREGGVQRAMKHTSAISVAGIITFSHDASKLVKRLDKQEQDRLFLKTAEKLAEKLDTTVTGLIVHRDESAVHAHFQMPAIRHNGRPVSKGCTRELLSELQDTAGLVWAEHGIERGIKKSARLKAGATLQEVTHRSVQQLHQDLPREIEAAQAKAEKNRALAEKAEADLKTASAKAETSQAEIDRIEKRLAVYEKRVNDAEKLLERHPRPKPVAVEYVKSREKRLFGLLPDKIQTEKCKVIPPSQMEKWGKSVADEAADKLHRAEELEAREERVSRLEASMKGSVPVADFEALQRRAERAEAWLSQTDTSALQAHQQFEMPAIEMPAIKPSSSADDDMEME